MPFDHQHAWGKVKPIQIKTWLNLKKFKYFHIFARFADMQNEKKCLKIASCLKTTLCWAKNIWISRFYPLSLTTVLSVGSTVNVFWCFLLRTFAASALTDGPPMLACCICMCICICMRMHSANDLCSSNCSHKWQAARAGLLLGTCSSCCSCVRVLLQY